MSGYESGFARSRAMGLLRVERLQGVERFRPFRPPRSSPLAGSPAVCPAALYYTILYYTMLYYSILYYTILYYTIL